MHPAVIIIIIIVVLYFLFSRNKGTTTSTITNGKPTPTPPLITTVEPELNDRDTYIDEKGDKYYILDKTRQVPRKTYIKGIIVGKYHGESEPILEEAHYDSKFFDFNIYEATIFNVNTQTHPYYFNPDTRFPKEKLPNNLPVILEKDVNQYAVNILEPQLQNVVFNRKLHQTEGDEVFGTIKGEITGYLLDFIVEHYQVRVYISRQDNSTNKLESDEDIIENDSDEENSDGVSISEEEGIIDENFDEQYSDGGLISKEKNTTLSPVNKFKTKIPTGKEEKSGNYKRLEYWYSNYKETYWSNWIYTGPPGPAGGPGCFSILGMVIGIALLILFLTTIGPQGILSLLVIAAIILVLAFFSEIIKWVFRIALLLMLIGLIVSVISSIGKRYSPSKPLKDTTEVKRDSLINSDSVIIQHRVWKDYDNHIFEGDYWISLMDYKNSRIHKRSISANYNQYDNLLNTLYKNDANKLSGVYHLLESIKKANNQNQIKFAENIVCFVQDIPYTLVLEKDCDASQYSDAFTRSYLLNNQGDCDPFEKFGINTPVEFMSTLKGDCDTRTLLLFTILSHYNYDVAILSSDYFSHSMLGINLPISGDALETAEKKYVFWETTSPGIRPGVIPREVSDINYWRISLQSKP